MITLSWGATKGDKLEIARRHRIASAVRSLRCARPSRRRLRISLTQRSAVTARSGISHALIEGVSALRILRRHWSVLER
jgi:hypothetical protein